MNGQPRRNFQTALDIAVRRCITIRLIDVDARAIISPIASSSILQALKWANFADHVEQNKQFS
ncbi:hypothetical protein NSU_4551 [Novosphingobium pentaromativorans US6-1]|uniref:Uncharacterized protein n=1 Tax=Novosphingobium pentaromativorans US6-1 TaxID=1088721 RepID=G6EJN0_9SPHN|nr:hypothetical protein NSU_4551 [Novosphingobium pentaromativorans US6-1]